MQAFGCLHQLPAFGHGEAASRLARDFDGGRFGNTHDETLGLCVCQNFASGHKVLQDRRGRKAIGTELLHEDATAENRQKLCGKRNGARDFVAHRKVSYKCSQGNGVFVGQGEKQG